MSRQSHVLASTHRAKRQFLFAPLIMSIRTICLARGPEPYPLICLVSDLYLCFPSTLPKVSSAGCGPRHVAARITGSASIACRLRTPNVARSFPETTQIEVSLEKSCRAGLCIENNCSAMRFPEMPRDQVFSVLAAQITDSASIACRLRTPQKPFGHMSLVHSTKLP
ncbi:hypothetical protein BV25DRAFT_768014 [Artomyces pyxidatus]|uniref:Uncharacterized protein n=1 Tax=Artomyces pyxidatus TaxID=48021 RepID=A0ACB8T057_9AGAM|nr:hypothetical protein BV25DRAFT_768014 [Artomyces pyxidatus]